MADEVVKRVRTRHFSNAKQQGIKITGLTSYDMLTAAIFDRAGIDFLLVGDSAGNNVLGYDTTVPVTLDDLRDGARGLRIRYRDPRTLLLVSRCSL
jgi:3-methyl-2-oxobutanoate hydroxymethyltransferase